MQPPIGLIGAPSSAGAFAPGQEKAPGALREAKLVDRLRDQGLDVVDYGDTPRFRWRPDPDNRFAQNADAVLSTVEAVRRIVQMVLQAGRFPLTIGGDCTIEIGTVLGFEPVSGKVGLFYFDAHPDLNRPVAPGPGALDWTGVAHLLNEPNAIPRLARAGARVPILGADQIYLFGHDPAQQTPLETEGIERLGLLSTTISDIEADPEGAAASALAKFAPGFDRLLVHFDVDVIDFTELPLSHNAERNKGLSFDAAMRALAVVLGSGRVGALTITELNPDFGDDEGVAIGAFVDRLAIALSHVTTV